MIGHEAVCQYCTTWRIFYKVRNFVILGFAIQDALGNATWVNQIISKNFSEGLIILVVLKYVLLVCAPIVDVIITARYKNTLIVETGH